MKHQIVICMGSSCFARGNQTNLKVIQDFLVQHPELDCELKGRGCIGKCRGGPNLKIDSEDFEQIDPETLIDLLNNKLR